MLPENSDSNN